MIEFTLSRAVMCVCGIALLGVALGVMTNAEDAKESEMDEDLAESIASLLNEYQNSQLDVLKLHGMDLIPRDGQTVSVSNHVVTVTRDGKESKAYTLFDGTLEMNRNSEIQLRKTPLSIGDVDYENCIEVDGRTIGSFVVTVTDQDGEYLEGAAVILSGMNVSSDGKTPHATTGADGRAVFTDLTIDPLGNSKTGNLTIEISKDGYTSDKTYKVLVIL